MTSSGSGGSGSGEVTCVSNGSFEVIDKAVNDSFRVEAVDFFDLAACLDAAAFDSASFKEALDAASFIAAFDAASFIIATLDTASLIAVLDAASFTKADCRAISFKIPSDFFKTSSMPPSL